MPQNRQKPEKLLFTQTLRLYWNVARQHKVSFFLMLVLIPSGALVIDTLLPYFLSKAIGGLTAQDFSVVKHFLIVATSIGILGALLNYAGFRAMVTHESRVLSRLRLSVFEQLMAKDLSFFNNNKVGAMTSRYIDFVRAEVQVQDLFIIRTLGFILSVGLGVGLIGIHSPALALLIFGLIIVLVIQIRWSMKIRAPWRHERKTLVGEIHGNVADALTNNLVVKTFAGEARELGALRNMTERFSKVYMKDIGFTVAEGSARVALMVIVQAISVIVAAHMVIDGSLDIAIAIFILAYMQRIGSQLFVLGEIINGYDFAFLDADPMTRMLLSPVEISDKDTARTLRVDKPLVQLTDVTFAFSDSPKNVLRDINLTIQPGEKIGLVGHSGAGKTTITQLLLRFHDVTGGAITIDGTDIRDVTQTSLRENIAYVPQEPLMFHKTLRENIAYGKPGASDKEIVEAAKKAHAYEFISDLPDGLDTLVGERGVKLSGGQRQRIAIARAILKDAPILLLDEATSALDSESERLIQDSLSRLMENRTAIVIAHRLSTIQKMDRIIVLEKGQIIEEGSHRELLRQNGTYAKLWSHQSGGFIEE